MAILKRFLKESVTVDNVGDDIELQFQSPARQNCTVLVIVKKWGRPPCLRPATLLTKLEMLVIDQTVKGLGFSQSEVSYYAIINDLTHSVLLEHFAGKDGATDEVSAQSCSADIRQVCNPAHAA